MCYSPESVLQAMGIQRGVVSITCLESKLKQHRPSQRRYRNQKFRNFNFFKANYSAGHGTCFKADTPTGHLEIDELTPLPRVWL